VRRSNDPAGPARVPKIVTRFLKIKTLLCNITFFYKPKSISVCRKC
jgi:hypothetical protein